MECPKCQSTHIRKNGNKRGKQNHICADCHSQFVLNPKPDQGYSDDTKRLCLKMYLNGMGFGGIERVTDVHHTTVIHSVKQVGAMLPDAYTPETIPEVGELDELETNACSKKLKSGARSAVDHFRAGILGWVLGDGSGETFAPLWEFVATWQCYFIVTDGWSVYPGFIPPGDQIVSKTYMTRVEGENTRLRHYESAPSS